MLVTGREAQRLLIDQLPEAIEEGRIRGCDRNIRQRLLEPERGKLFSGMRKKIDADADRANFGRRFKYRAGNSRCVQGQAERQSTNAGTDDNNVVHVSFPAPIATRLPG